MLRFVTLLSVSVLLASPPTLAEPDVMRVASIEPARPSFWGRPSTAAAAAHYLGASGPQLGLPSRLWCGDFVNLVRKRAGLRVVPSRRAVDQARYGIRLAKPEAGALMITGRKGGHHVDLIVAVHADGSVTTVGGNVSRRVTQRHRVARGIFIRPL